MPFSRRVAAARLLPLLLIAGSGPAVPCRVDIVPRLDGLLLEVRSLAPIEPSISVSGLEMDITCGLPMMMTAAPLPVWLDSIGISPDSCRLSLLLDSRIGTVDWALSPDSTSLRIFMRSDSVFYLPTLSWEGPPVELETVSLSQADSMASAALRSGEMSPWLSEFDCVVLDPGHGGRDPGAVGPAGTYEKERTLQIALLVRDLMALEMPSVRVILTRDSDSYASLGSRTRLANASRADLFVSIHCNASTRREAEGFETYFLSLARSDDARAVAALENGSAAYDLPEESSQAGDPLQFLLADMAQNIYLENSSSLAGLIQSNISAELPSLSDRGVKQAGFYVLRGAWMPSILVESAFISNPGEEQLLGSLDFRFRIARAIVSSIRGFATGQGVYW